MGWEWWYSNELAARGVPVSCFKFGVFPNIKLYNLYYKLQNENDNILSISMFQSCKLKLAVHKYLAEENV